MDAPSGSPPPPEDSTLSTSDIDRLVRDHAGITGARAGDQVGPYRLLGLLGEGGFGEVWLAERREPFVQRVALKVIKPGMDSKAVIARFEQERQALAVMDHPNVAKVLDGGVTPASMGSRPYFVMEHVQGEPITTYCDRHRLTIRQRLELFIPVCEAVQHAHMKGIIHRDIKPSNVLVAIKDQQAISKVIDFGVAKAISQTLTEKTIFTEQGQLIGTPEYMSPEQAEMGAVDIDTRTDVYSLGVLLYELLSGTLPFDPQTLRSAGYAEVQRIIRGVEAPTASRRLTRLDNPAVATIALARDTPEAILIRELRRELDWIPAKCLQKDRTRRYGTPAELAEEVRSYLRGGPLRAGPDSLGYRMRKLVTGHRQLAAALLGSVSVLLITIGTLLFAQNRQMSEANAAALALALTRESIARNLQVFRRFETDWPLSYEEAIGSNLVVRAIQLWKQLLPRTDFSKHIAVRGGSDAELAGYRQWYADSGALDDDQILLLLLGGPDQLSDEERKRYPNRLPVLSKAESRAVMQGWDADEWRLRSRLLYEGVEWIVSAYVEMSRPAYWYGDGTDYAIVYPSGDANSLLRSMLRSAGLQEEPRRRQRWSREDVSTSNSTSLVPYAQAQVALERVVFPADSTRSATAYRRTLAASGAAALLACVSLLADSRAMRAVSMILVVYAALTACYWATLHTRFAIVGAVFFVLPVIAVLAPGLVAVCTWSTQRRWPLVTYVLAAVFGCALGVLAATRVISIYLLARILM
jgi:serine/threonine protein kinase